MLLKILLREPLCVGAGVGKASLVDRDVVLNAVTGLPYIPARRIKGVLRDEYQQIHDAGALRGLPPAHELFGSVGAEESGPVRIGNARWFDTDGPDAGFRMDEWLRHAVTHGLKAEEITRHFTEIRRQTSIDRATGSARRDTLRFTRVLREGLIFAADIRLSDPALVPAFAIAAAAVHVMGSGRSRGVGKVECWLEDDNGQRVEIGQDEPAARPRDSKSGAVDPPIPAGDTIAVTPPSHRLRYWIQLEDAATLPTLAKGDPNTVMTHDHVPGPAVHGLFAKRALQSSTAANRFYELFASGSILFLPATPAIVEDIGGGEPLLRTMEPTPLSIRRTKEKQAHHIDLAKDDPGVAWDDDVYGEKVRFSKRAEQAWFQPEEWSNGDPSEAVTIDRELQYHHARAADKRIQRAIGGDVGEPEVYGLTQGQTGALFVYENLAAGQCFAGEILGSREDLELIAGLIGENDPVTFGRSVNAQYGGNAIWHWLTGGEPGELTQTTAGKNENGHYAIRLVTPLIGVNENGHPSPAFDLDELGGGLELKASFTRTAWTGGYLGHQRLPRRQVPALAAGSVFVVAGELPDPEAAQRRSYGLRTEEGFGRISIAPLFPPRRPFNQARDIRREAAVKRVTPNHNQAWNLLRTILAERARDQVRSFGAGVPNQFSGIESVNPHLIYRLIRTLESAPGDRLAALIADVKSARKKAARQLDACRIANETLAEYLVRMAGNPRFDRIQAGLFRADWDQIADSTAKLRGELENDAALAAETMRVFLVRVLSGLAKRIKQERNGGRK
jgi:CRISPR-associated protein Csx10